MTALCLPFGVLISVIVSALKGVSFIKTYPKTSAFVLSLLSTVLTLRYGVNDTLSWTLVSRCVLEQFASAVTTHEAVTNQVKKVRFQGGKP